MITDLPSTLISPYYVGELVLYPMYTENKCQERKPSAPVYLSWELDGITKVINFRFRERRAEMGGTGLAMGQSQSYCLLLCSMQPFMSGNGHYPATTLTFFTAADWDKLTTLLLHQCNDKVEKCRYLLKSFTMKSTKPTT